MNVLNRVLVVLFLLGLIVSLVAGIFELPLTVEMLHNGLNYLLDLALANQIAFWGVSAALLFGAILLLIFEFYRPQRRTVRVQQASGSIVELSIDSVTDSLLYHITQVPGVRAAQPLVISKGSAVQVFLDLQTDPDIELPAKSEEVVQLTRELVEGRLGLKVASVKVNIRAAGYGREQAPAVSSRHEPKGELPTPGPALGV